MFIHNYENEGLNIFCSKLVKTLSDWKMGVRERYNENEFRHQGVYEFFVLEQNVFLYPLWGFESRCVEYEFLDALSS